MGSLLAAYRITVLVLWSVLIALLSIPYQLQNGWSRIRKLTRLSQMWAKGVGKIIGLHIVMTGKIPRGMKGLIVSNHLSYLDIIVHGSAFPVRYAPKSDIAAWPVLGWYIGLSCPIWTDRESRYGSRKTMKDFADTLKEEVYLIVYPEGTSSNGKAGILPFKSTPFEAAITENAPILPVLIRYKETADAHTVCWYGDMRFLPHAWRVLQRPYIEAELRFLPAVYTDGKSRKELAASVHELMSREYQNMTL